MVLLRQILQSFCVNLIKGYRYFISPLLGPRCRFFPTCSSYALQAIEKYGLSRGLLKTTTRICKCHPLHKGGVDLP